MSEIADCFFENHDTVVIRFSGHKSHKIDKQAAQEIVMECLDKDAERIKNLVIDCRDVKGTITFEAVQIFSKSALFRETKLNIVIQVTALAVKMIVDSFVKILEPKHNIKIEKS